jgi:hypothetical protein
MFHVNHMGAYYLFRPKLSLQTPQIDGRQFIATIESHGVNNP